MNLIAELKRRNVIRMAGLYLVGAWLIVQVAGTVLPMFGVSALVVRSIVIVLVIGFLPAMIVAWIFELTPDGLKRDADVTPQDSIAPQTARRMNRLILIVAVVAIGYFVFDKFVLAPRRDATLVTQTTAHITAEISAEHAKGNTRSIAVLPFENLSAEKENAYFADGIQDEILTSLAKIGDLKVISRTSTQRYASRPDNIAEIAKQLDVANILEGSVQKSGNRVRINVQLIRADTDSHLWAETYDRSLDDIFAVQSEVAEKIALSLTANLTHDEREALAQTPTKNPAAYTGYLKARALNTGVVVSRVQADAILDAYRDAVKLDPDFALAWAELAREDIRTHWVGFDPSGALRKEGENALARAQQLAPDLPQTRLAQAVFLYYIQLDYAGALTAMKAVNKALPGYADAWLFSGFLSRRLGLWEESATDLERARVLAPNDASIAYHLGVNYVSMRQCTRAMPLLDASLKLQADNPAALWVKLQCAWVDADLVRADRMLADQPLDTSSYTALRAMQALFKHDYAQASELYRRAIAGAGDIHIDSDFNGYVPVVVNWRLLLALSEQRAGKAAAAHTLYSQVKVTATSALAGKPDNPYVEAGWHAALGLALAGLGEHQPATEQASLVTALVPESKDALEGPAWADYVARIYALNGDATRAIPLLQHLMQTKSSVLGSGYLQLDPAWDPIRHDPRFEALLKKYASAKPAAASNEVKP
jgi:TolB-like protein